MTDLAVISTPGALDQYADPGEFVILACERARDWLREAISKGDIEQIGEIKSQAEAVRVYTTQKQYGHDAELAAAEIVRRAERGIGLAIRKGQADGVIRRPERHGIHDADSIPPTVAAGVSHPSALTDSYALADGVTDEQFDAALHDAKVNDGDLSRANVKRAVARQKITNPSPDQQAETRRTQARVDKARELAGQGYTSRQIGHRLFIENVGVFMKRHGIEVPADAVVGKTHRIDHNRVVREAVLALEGATYGLGLVDVSKLNQTDVPVWATSLRESIKTLNRFLKEISS